ncbi:TylF/MycF/NovP-related O-methyltransferase [Paenibacillus thermoaerophilus]|uniref:TylF/MycF/NovP-related O-methyltransferase n=1 Tax=Paenibacillus thermoaerophilus TaxID=1215385 RepID=A0ABW2V4N7_9BACL|nr:TylF/MycF/NovP-related O-methyltransferase [Paenibacillus thermoaerophilus]TMV07354.1 class I SAM-dependent methyltransferase [Paenibacillus thermoaerophilus]
MSESYRPMGMIGKHHRPSDFEAYRLTEETFESSGLSVFNKLEAFPRFATKRSLAKFLCRYEVYKQVLGINGSFVECGVFNGGGLFTWAQLANIYEPANHSRKIIGFDTFSGFPSVGERDQEPDREFKAGDLKGETLEQLSRSVQKYNAERYLSHIPNIELVQGDFMQTGEAFLERNKHLMVALLYLDFDLYEPTKKALELFLPRMGKGSIVCFDELNCASFPGETTALYEMLPIRETSIRRFPTDPWLSYVVL